MRIETINDIKYYIGRNEKENWNLFDEADPSDLWFHLDEGSSCYVFLPSLSFDRCGKSIIEAAKLCKAYSIKNVKDIKKKVKIIYCEVKYLKKGRVIGEIIVDDDHLKSIKV